jgi:hypothetical protein
VAAEFSTPDFLPFVIPVIKQDARGKACQEEKYGKEVNQLFRKIDTRNFKKKEMYVGIRSVSITQFPSYFPVPVGAYTISPTIPDT